MKSLWLAVAALAAVLEVACSSTGDFEPIVVDLSKNKAAAATPTARATPTPTPGIVPAPTEPPPPPATPAPATPAPAATPARTPAAAPARSEPPRSPEAVARAREDAFNRRDLDALSALYAPDARVFEPPDRLRDSGVSSIREAYARTFSMAPDARVRATETMTEGQLAVIHETLTGAGTSRSSIRILEVREGRIAVEWILR
ncbi:MAG TPA: nuclear transport factor 2 family protein [Thermoanaerobaculia bacterium]